MDASETHEVEIQLQLLAMCKPRLEKVQSSKLFNQGLWLEP